MTFKVCNDDSKQPYFNRAYVVGRCLFNLGTVQRNKTKTLVSAREVMAERVKKKRKAMTQKQSLEKKL